jgi:hypothetical protein
MCASLILGINKVDIYNSEEFTNDAKLIALFENILFMRRSIYKGDCFYFLFELIKDDEKRPLKFLRCIKMPDICKFLVWKKSNQIYFS